jgi:protein transport protein SEC31
VAIIVDRVFNSGSIQFSGLPTPPFPFELEIPSSTGSAPQIKPTSAPAQNFSSLNYRAPNTSQTGYAPTNTGYAPNNTPYVPPTTVFTPTTTQFGSTSSFAATTATTAFAPTPYAPTTTTPSPFAPTVPASAFPTPYGGQPSIYTPSYPNTNPAFISPPPTSAPSDAQKSPQKANNWNDPPAVAPKQKTTSTNVQPIFSPIASQGMGNQNNFIPTTASAPTFAAPPPNKQPIDIGPPKQGFQRGGNSSPPPAFHQPNPSLIPQPQLNIIQPQTNQQQPPQQFQQQGQPFQQQGGQQFSQQGGQQFSQQGGQQFSQQGGQQFSQQGQQFQQQPQFQQQGQPFQQPPQFQQPVQASPTPKPQEKSATPKKKAPTGDRSKIPQEQRPIFTILSSALTRLEANPNPQLKKPVEDTKKRLDTLFEKLNESEVPENLIGSFLELAKGKKKRNLIIQFIFLKN